MPKTKVEIESFIWKGQTRYKCPLTWEGGARCEYDSQDLDALKKHMVSDHTRPNGLKTRVEPNIVLGADGKPLHNAPDPVTPIPEFEFVKFKAV